MILQTHYFGSLSLIVVLFCPSIRGQIGTDEDYNNVDSAFTLSPFTFPPVTAGGLSYNLPGNLGSGRDCFKNFPHLKRRFSPEQLEFFCQQKRLYDDIISSDGTKVNPFTPQQLAWIDSLRLTINESTPSFNKVIRKEVRKLTNKEWRRFSNAIRYMKGTRIDGVSHYDLLVMLSHPALAPGAQVGAAFLPWHREYLRMFEVVLRRYHRLNTIPYWDSTLDYPLPDPTGSIVWTPLRFGNNQGIVQKGPFRMFLFRSDNVSAGFPLKREAGVNGSLYSPELVNFFNSKSIFRDITAYVDLTIEQANRKLHEWVGGSMNSIYYALQDPVALTNFAFLDYLWEEFRNNRQTPTNRTTDYPKNYEAGTSFHYGHSEMKPFGPLRNIDGMSNLYTDTWYEYEPRPTCSQLNPTCYSQYLFCDPIKERCVSKVRLGASCRGLGSEVCFRGACYDDICRLEPPVISPTNELLNSLEPTLLTRRETVDDNSILKPTEELQRGSSPSPPPEDTNFAPAVTWFATVTAEPDRLETTSAAAKPQGTTRDGNLPSIETIRQENSIRADIVETPKPKRPKPTKTGDRASGELMPGPESSNPTTAGSATHPPTTQGSIAFPDPDYPTVAGKNKTHSSGETFPDGRPKQTSEEDVDPNSGRPLVTPEGNTKSPDTDLNPDATEKSSSGSGSTESLTSTSKRPSGDSGEFLPDGRPRQTSEEDVGGGHRMVLPHEEGKPPVWVTPGPGLDEDTD